MLAILIVICLMLESQASIIQKFWSADHLARVRYYGIRKSNLTANIIVKSTYTKTHMHDPNVFHLTVAITVVLH
jgi:hypothetical protein